MKQYFEPSATLLALTKEDILNVSGEHGDIISPLEQEEMNDFGGFKPFA